MAWRSYPVVPILRLPLTHGFRDRLQPVATLHYNAEGCDGAQYRSAIVVRADMEAGGLPALEGLRVAVNDLDSQSGLNCLRAKLASLDLPSPFFAAMRLSGGHRASLAAVAGGICDVAAIDAVTLALLRQYAPDEVAGIRILDWSDAAPGLPLVTAINTPPAEIAHLRAGLKAVLQDRASQALLAPLLISGMTVTGPGDYERILEMEREADDFALAAEVEQG